MVNNRNDLSSRTPEERVEIARMGGKASGVARRRSASLRDAMQRLLKMGVLIGTPEEVCEELAAAGLDNPTVAEAIVVSAMIRASRGDVEAMRFVRDTAGENPASRVELSGDPTRPVSTLDLRGLTDQQLMEIIEQASEDEEA